MHRQNCPDVFFIHRLKRFKNYDVQSFLRVIIEKGGGKKITPLILFQINLPIDACEKEVICFECDSVF